MGSGWAILGLESMLFSRHLRHTNVATSRHCLALPHRDEAPDWRVYLCTWVRPRCHPISSIPDVLPKTAVCCCLP